MNKMNEDEKKGKGPVLFLHPLFGSSAAFAQARSPWRTASRVASKAWNASRGVWLQSSSDLVKFGVASLMPSVGAQMISVSHFLKLVTSQQPDFDLLSIFLFEPLASQTRNLQIWMSSRSSIKKELQGRASSKMKLQTMHYYH